MVNVVKRSGGSEPLLRHKLHESLMHALHAARALEGEAALLASRTSNEVLRWCETKPEVTSRDIRARSARLLYELHPEAAYAYASYDSTI